MSLKSVKCKQTFNNRRTCLEPLHGGHVLLLASSVKLIAEIALLAFAGQFLLGLLAGSKRDSNLFYQLLQLLTKPFVKAVRLISPRFVLDRHIPLATALLMSSIWIFAVIAKLNICMQGGANLCA